jgi:tartrate dehydratase beta subunit/fumarate hydratase class I family protein
MVKGLQDGDSEELKTAMKEHTAVYFGATGSAAALI